MREEPLEDRLLHPEWTSVCDELEEEPVQRRRRQHHPVEWQPRDKPHVTEVGEEPRLRHHPERETVVDESYDELVRVGE